MPATRPFLPRTLLAFDVDGTLGPHSLDVPLGLYGTTRADWGRDIVDPLGDGWDEIIRRGQALIELGRAKGRPLTLARLQEAGRTLKPFPAATEMPARLRAVAQEIHPKIGLSFVVLSSGSAEVIKANPVAAAFDRVLASTFHFATDGRVLCGKRVTGHPEEALSPKALAKDVGVGGANAPQSAGRDLPAEERFTLYDQMIHVGDGSSDRQAFGLMRTKGGLAVAIDKDDRFDPADQQRPGQRPDNLAPPDDRTGANSCDPRSTP